MELYNLPRDVLITQLMDGLVLLVLGMGTVFVFLVILIFATKLMSKLCNKGEAAPAAAAKTAAASTPVQAAVPVQDDSAIAVAIAAAYDRSRN